MKLKRIFSIFLALALIISIAPAALADPDPLPLEASEATTTVTLTDAGVGVDTAYILATISNSSGEDITLQRAKSPSKRVVKETGNDLVSTPIPNGDTVSMLFKAELKNSATGSVTETFEFTFISAGGKTITKTTSVTLNFGEPSPVTPDPNAVSTPAFRLSAYDANLKLVATPAGNAGDRITVRIPLYCLKGPAENVSITPKLSTNLEEFPFDIEQLDYAKYYDGSVRTGEITEVSYNLKLAKKVTAGVKKVDFIVSYTNSDWKGGEMLTATVSIYINVIKGYTEGTGGTPGVVSQPKLILEKYSVSADKIYAGEEFEVYFTLKNTSTVEAVQNIQISISDTAETGKLLPAENGSNTIYIARIDKGESYDITYKMQCAADMDPKAYKIGVAMAYEGAKNVAAYTANDTISVTILQKIRLKFDTPVFYDEFYVGSPSGVYLAMYNMGRSSVYNCMISVEGDGLQLEESYFGGTVAAGGTMSADFNIIANTPGQIEGAIVVTYEDSLGEQMEERIPLSLFVMDMGDINGPVVEPGIEPDIGIDTGATPDGSGMPVWGWIAIGLGVAGCAAAVLLVLKKKRGNRRNLEEV